MPVRRCEEGMALVTTIILTAVMLVMGYALLSLVDTQTAQTRQQRTGETAFGLAEATLESQAFLLGRTWPQTSTAGTCGSAAQTRSGTLTIPANTSTPALQVQNLLAHTYKGEGVPTIAEWHVNVCEMGGRSSWDATLLNGAAYDNQALADPVTGARRMWVRAEGEVSGRRRAVVGLVQAGKAPVLPPNLAVVTGRLKTNITSNLGNLTSGPLTNGILGSLLGSTQPEFRGAVGLRCSLLDADILTSGPGCLEGIYTLTSMTTLRPLLQASEYTHFESDAVLSNDQVAQLRQQAKANSTYYGPGEVAAGASCLPVNSSGNVIFIERIGTDGTGRCTLDTAANPSAKALIVVSGGVKVTTSNLSTPGTFTGVIYARHRTALSGNAADIRIENGAKVVGGVYVDDNPALATSVRRGQVEVVPPQLSISTSSPLCNVFLLGFICNTVDVVVGLLGVGPVLAGLLPQLNSSLPAVTYNANVVNALTAFGDSAVVPGTFRQVAPRY